MITLSILIYTYIVYLVIYIYICFKCIWIWYLISWMSWQRRSSDLGASLRNVGWWMRIASLERCPGERDKVPALLLCNLYDLPTATEWRLVSDQSWSRFILSQASFSELWLWRRILQVRNISGTWGLALRGFFMVGVAPLTALVFQGALFSSMTFLGLGLAGLETVNCEVGWVLPGCRGWCGHVAAGPFGRHSVSTSPARWWTPLG